MLCVNHIYLFLSKITTNKFTVNVKFKVVILSICLLCHHFDMATPVCNLIDDCLINVLPYIWDKNRSILFKILLEDIPFHVVNFYPKINEKKLLMDQKQCYLTIRPLVVHLFLLNLSLVSSKGIHNPSTVL